MQTLSNRSESTYRRYPGGFLLCITAACVRCVRPAPPAYLQVEPLRATPYPAALTTLVFICHMLSDLLWMKLCDLYHPAQQEQFTLLNVRSEVKRAWVNAHTSPWSCPVQIISAACPVQAACMWGRRRWTLSIVSPTHGHVTLMRVRSHHTADE